MVGQNRMNHLGVTTGYTLEPWRFSNSSNAERRPPSCLDGSVISGSARHLAVKLQLPPPRINLHSQFNALRNASGRAPSCLTIDETLQSCFGPDLIDGHYGLLGTLWKKQNANGTTNSWAIPTQQRTKQCRSDQERPHAELHLPSRCEFTFRHCHTKNRSEKKVRSHFTMVKPKRPSTERRQAL